MILIINVCKERLHYYEFVKSVEEITKANGCQYFTKNYKEVGEKDLERADKVIICGTSLQDYEFLKNISKFSWIKSFDKPILGICAGMQILGIIFGGKSGNYEEIGYYHEGFDRGFLGLSGEVQIYHLHQNFISDVEKEFNVYSKSKIIQAIKHKFRPFYGCLFHPEVRNKEVIGHFLLLR